MEASTAGRGPGVGQQAQGFRFSCNLFVSHSVACQQPVICREHRRCRGKHVLRFAEWQYWFTSGSCWRAPVVRDRRSGGRW